MAHDDESPLSERAQQAIKDGEDAWVQASSGTWDSSSWWRMGTALTLIRQQVLHTMGINTPRGGPYNAAFARRISDTKFATMESVTRSNLLFLMEPENRIVLDKLLAKWKPDVRARRTHPTTLAQHVRREQKPPQPKPAAPAKPAPAPKGEPVMTLDMISTKSGREQAAVFMRQQAKKMQQKEAEIREQMRVEFSNWFAELTAKYREKEEHYDLISSRWKGLMKRADYNNIMFCIHPDQYMNRTDKQRDAAQMLWRELEKVLVKAEDAPAKPSSLPKTKEELLKHKAEHDARRKAGRDAAKAKREAER